MKTICNLLMVMTFLFCISCNKNNDNLDALINKGLNGKWNLISVSCECPPINLEKGQQIWYIDTLRNKLTVENYVKENLHTLFQSGEYSIAINHTNRTVTIRSTEYSYFFDGEGNLFLGDRPEVDGPLIKFVRD